jgi:hypothetical protein
MALSFKKEYHISPIPGSSKKLLNTKYKRVSLDEIKDREVYFQYPCPAGTVEPFTEIKNITITIKNKNDNLYYSFRYDESIPILSKETENEGKIDVSSLVDDILKYITLIDI